MKREIKHFHVVVVQKREGNVQKSVMHMQSCCFAYKTYCFFFTFSLPSASLDLEVPILAGKRDRRRHTTTVLDENVVVTE